jgi:hypothetical protein
VAGVNREGHFLNALITGPTADDLPCNQKPYGNNGDSVVISESKLKEK